MNKLRRVRLGVVSRWLAGVVLAGVGTGAWAQTAAVNPVSPAAPVVGHVRDYRENDKGVVDAWVILGEQKGVATGYADLTLAKVDAIALPGIEVIFQTGRIFKIYAVRLIDNTPENIERLAKGELATLTEDPLDVLKYRKLKCVMKSELMLDQPARGQPRAVNVVDERGLFVASYRMKEAARGSKLLRMTIDWELMNGNFLEAKEVYLFLEDLNVKNQDLAVVQAMVRANLRTFMESKSPELHAFAEAEMTRRGYSEKQMAEIRGTP
jgi:hypothetical protein